MRLLNRDLWKDSLFISASLIIFTVFGLALHAELTSLFVRSDGERLGTVVFKKRVAQRKYDDQVIWQTVPDHAVLYVNDSVRTEEDSEAMLILDDGTRIDLGEDTLILLVRRGKGLGLDFRQGFLSAFAGEEERPGFEITSGDTRLDLTRADAVLQKNAGSEELLVDVTRGQAVFEQGAARLTIEENARLLLRKGAPGPVVEKARLIPTGGGGVAFIEGKSVSRTFSWIMNPAGEGTLEIARSASFSGNVLTRTTTNQSIAVDLGEGTWFWRVRAPDGSTSRIERTMLVAIQAPQPLSPSNETRFTYYKKLPLISMQWSGDTSAGEYTVEIAKDANFENRIHTAYSRMPSIAIDTLGEGRYWWRVTPRSGITSLTPGPGPASSFIIEKLERAPAIEILPENIVSTLQFEAQHVSVSWKGSPEYVKYRLELSNLTDFSASLYTEETTANFSRLRSDIPEGKYSMRVTAMDEDGAVLTRSAVSGLDVRMPEAVTLLTPEDEAVLPGANGDVQVAFSWNDPNRGGRTRFEVAGDSDFQDMRLTVTTSRTSQSLRLPVGEYFWRAATVNTLGEPVTEAVTRQFLITETLAAPVLRRPAPGAIVDIERTNSITFAWDRVQNAGLYRLSLYRAQGYGWQLVHEIQVTQPFYTCTHLNRLIRGRNAWEVRALPLAHDKARTPGKPIRSEFVLRLPEVKNIEADIPEVLYVD